MIKVEFNPESFKVWSKCVNALLKFGNEITIKLEDEEMTLSTTSDCSSSFVLFTFHKPFFENYKVNDNLCLKLLTKPLANILKHNTEIEKCILKVQNDILSLGIECLHKVVKIHSFYYEEATLRKAIYSIKNENTWSIHPKALMDILLSFPSTSDEISIATNTDSFEITNFKKICDNEKRDLNTMVSIELIDFTDYIIAKDSISSLDIKELKKILVFGECFDFTIEANYNSIPGMPFVFLYRPADYCSAEFVLATLAEGAEVETQAKQKLSRKSSAKLDQESVGPGVKQKKRLTKVDSDTYNQETVRSGVTPKQRVTRVDSDTINQETVGSGVKPKQRLQQQKKQSPLNIPIQTSIYDEKEDTNNLSQSNSSETLNIPTYLGKSLFENLKTTMKNTETEDLGYSDDEQVQATQYSKKPRTL